MKFCPECGNNIEGMKFCSECGYKISSDIVVQPSDVEIVEIAQNDVVVPTVFRATSEVGYIQVDEYNQLFRIYGKSNEKRGGLGASLVRGTMAISTMGMSVIADKALGISLKKVGNKDSYTYDQLIAYELLENDSVVVSGGVGMALVGGVLFSAPGAIAGALTGKRKHSKKIDSLYLKITLNDFDNPSVIIPLISKPVKSTSNDYKDAFELAHKMLSMLDVIAHQEK